MLLGFTIPDPLLQWINENDTVLATQTHRFSWGLVRAMRDAHCQVQLLSTVPVSDYPRNPRLFWGFARFRSHGVSGVLMPFLNALGLKHLTRAISVMAIGSRELKRHKPSWLLVHGVHSPFLWFAVWARRALGVSACAVLTDPPGMRLETDSPLRRRLKDVDIRVTRMALERLDAVVVLARPLAEDFAAGVPAHVMEGIYDPTTWSIAGGASATSTFDVTYAGSLLDEYGVSDLVAAVMEWPDDRVRLHIYGRGPLESWIEQQAAIDPRISPPSLVPPERLAEIYAASNVLVQPRPAGQPFVPYSFPSKLIEYMGSGVPVVSTRLPSIPADYEDHVTWANEGAHGLRVALQRVAEATEDQRKRMGEDARAFILETKTSSSQGGRLREFLESARVR